MVIGNKITQLRKKYNYTQEKLAEKIGVTRQTLSNWESNITSPNLEQASELCKELKIDIKDLIDNNIELNIKDNSNKILSKLIDKEVYLEFDYVDYLDAEISSINKVKVIGINDEFIKVEINKDNKKKIKLIDINLITSIKIMEEN